tara:strand:+ start:1430 stop:2062 length:633 start_codon:yes stop_codon:yes gene_type:complete
MLANSFFKNIYHIPKLPKFSKYTFANIIDLPKNIHVHDFSAQNNFQKIKSPFSIGKYNEKRPNVYKGELFEKTNRFIHMGIDIGAPAGTNVKSFYEGEIFLFKNNHLKLDYGYTIITKHKFSNNNIFALYGHLSKASILNKKIGQKIHIGEEIATIGDFTENGGWPPHVHFQLSLIEPKNCDLPGVVSEKDHDIALKIFPDPRLVLGNLY